MSGHLGHRETLGIMIQTTDAVILRSTLFRETSQLLTFLTPDFGKIFVLAKGVRRHPRRFSSTFNLFTCNRIVFYERSRSNLQLLTQCDLLDPFPAIRKDLKKTAYAAYFSELVDRSTEPGHQPTPLYTLLLEALRQLAKRELLEETARIFEVKLLLLSGLMPELSQCQACRGPVTKRVALSLERGGFLCERCFQKGKGMFELSKGTLVSIRHIATSPWSLAYRMRMLKDSREELKESLKRFIDFYLDEKIYSRVFLKELEAF